MLRVTIFKNRDDQNTKTQTKFDENEVSSSNNHTSDQVDKNKSFINTRSQESSGQYKFMG